MTRAIPLKEAITTSLTVAASALLVVASLALFAVVAWTVRIAIVALIPVGIAAFAFSPAFRRRFSRRYQGPANP